MTTYEMQREIARLKEKNDIVILAHSYERQEVLEVADFTGDSYALACKVKSVPQKTVLLCGVRFMAETVKILAPEKRVLLSHADAGCPMAEQLSQEELLSLKKQHPGAVTAAYVNTTAALKAHADVCVTSSSAVKVLSRLPQKEILFVPDCNLGGYVAARLPQKKFYFYEGGCPVHLRATVKDVEIARVAHPDALLLVHPECRAEVAERADFAGSTAEIMAFAQASDKKEFIIGTDNSIVEHLEFACPEKRFYPLSKRLVCEDMRLTTLADVYRAVALSGGAEITLDEATRLAAKKCIDKMIELCG